MIRTDAPCNSDDVLAAGPGFGHVDQAVGVDVIHGRGLIYVETFNEIHLITTGGVAQRLGHDWPGLAVSERHQHTRNAVGTQSVHDRSRDMDTDAHAEIRVVGEPGRITGFHGDMTNALPVDTVPHHDHGVAGCPAALKDAVLIHGDHIRVG
jgi:hypothetical protein